MLKYSVEGKFLTQVLTGTQRYAYEIMKAIDAMPEAQEFEIVIPGMDTTAMESSFKNIALRHLGNKSGQIWSQVTFLNYCKKHKTIPVCLNNAAPLLSTPIVTIHDVSPLINKDFYDWKFRAFSKMSARFNVRRAKIIFTVTRFSKAEIERVFSSACGKINVVPCAWQHMDGVVADETILNRESLSHRGYVFALSSLTPNKNLKWIVETAKLNPDVKFVIAGGINTKVFGEHNIPQSPNVKYLGYITDEESKALMASCAAFLFPTFYEGFGIPPMEAMSCGAGSVIVSDIPCLREVYGNTVAYIDPNIPCPNISELIAKAPTSFDDVLSRYSWKRSAELYLSALQEA